jgi:hypothetical protein
VLQHKKHASLGHIPTGTYVMRERSRRESSEESCGYPRGRHHRSMLYFLGSGTAETDEEEQSQRSATLKRGTRQGEQTDERITA